MTEKKGVGRKKILVYILGILGIFTIVMLLPLVFGQRVDTVLPREWTYEVHQWGQGLIVKDEKVYKTDFIGETYPIVREGDRVRVGVEVAEVASLRDTTDLKNQLETIENWISFLENASSSNTDTNQSNMELILSSIQTEILASNLQKVSSLKENLLLLRSPDINEISDTDYSTSNLEELRIRRTQLINSLSQYSKKLYSNHSGIVSYNVDGLEESLRTTQLSDLSPVYFDIIEHEKDKTSVFKIVDSSEWYIGVLIDMDDQEYVLGRSYEIKITVNEDELLQIRVPLVQDLDFQDKRILIFKSTSYIGDVYHHRNVYSGILLSRNEALGIPNSSVFKKDGINGVFIKEFYGVVRFRKVEILGVEGDITYVSRGNNDGYLTSRDGDRIRTLTIHDEVIKDPSKVYEGQILK